MVLRPLAQFHLCPWLSTTPGAAMPGPDRSKKASNNRSRTPPKGPPPKAVPPASKALYVGAPRGQVLRKAAASAPGPGAPGSRRWAGALPRCRCTAHGDCQYPWCPLRRDPPPDAPGAAASAAPGAGVPKDGVPWAKPVGWAGLAAMASAAPGGSIPQTPAPTPSSSQSTTTTTNEFLADGEMVTVVTTRTTIITRAPGVDGSKESEASSSKD